MRRWIDSQEQNYQAYVDNVKQDNPWALYMLDELLPGSGFWTAKDSSGNGRDMNASAIAGFSNSAPLVVGSARSMTCNGTSFCVGANGPQSGNGQWAVDGWLSIASIAAGEKMFAGFGAAVAHQTAIAEVFSGFLGGDTNGCLQGDGVNILSINTIYYVCVQWDGSKLYIYKNAGLVASGACAAMSIPVGGGSHELWLAPAGVAGTNFSGTLQAVGFYDHNLSLASLQSRYNIGRGIYPSGPSASLGQSGIGVLT